MMKWPILIGVTLFVAVGGLIAVCVLYTLSGGKVPFDYGIVMDAGSTHTQITAYKWEGQKEGGTGKVTQVDTCKVKGGIQKLNLTEASTALLPCLKNVSKSIPENRHAATPIYLGATAGMRLLKLDDPFHAEAILMSIRCALQNSGFSLKTVGIISGKDEGIYAWITGNFLLDKLYVEEHEPYSTVGALDMGGASTQISYEIAPEHKVGNKTNRNLKLYGHNHMVFSESYLCFGSEEAMRRHHALLVGEPRKDNTSISDPCGLVGDAVNYTASDLFNHPCTRTKNSQSWLMDDDDKDVIYTFKGSGNNEECSAAVSKLLNYTGCQENYTECFESPHQPLANVQYMAVASYYWTAKYLNLTNTTLGEFEEGMRKYCNETYSEAMHLIDPSESEYAPYFCFEVHYIYQILVKGYHFNDITWRKINFVEKVNGADLGWALGYMIDATNAIPAEKPGSPYIALPTFIVLLVICILLLIASLLFLVRTCVLRSQYGYTSFPEF